MSYKIAKVNDQVSDSANETDLALSNIITVNSPVDGQFLRKAATDWETANVSPNSIAGKFNLDRTGNYSGGTYYYIAGHNYEWIKTKASLNPGQPEWLQTVTGWCPVNNSNFRMRFKFLASVFQGRTVILEASISPYVLSGSGTLEYQWVKGYTSTYTPLGPKTVVHGNKYSDMAFGHYINTGSDDEISLKVTYVSGNTTFRNSTGLTHNGEQVTIRMY